MIISRFTILVAGLCAVVLLQAQDEENLNQEIKEYEGYETIEKPAVSPEPEEIVPTKEETQEQDLKELQKDLEKGKTEKTAEVAPKKKWDFYHFFGRHISIRANDKFVYIKAGPTTVILDEKGRMQIKGNENILISTEKDLHLKAGGNIYMNAGKKIIRQEGDVSPEAD